MVDPPVTGRTPGQTPPRPSRPGARWVAIVTGALSILVGVLYLVMITILDARGPLRPPPPEALGLSAEPAAADGVLPGAAEVPPPG